MGISREIICMGISRDFKISREVWGNAPPEL
jgi:hypothetical protein